MSKLPQRQLQNFQSGSPSISDKESTDAHQLLLAHLYNYFKSNGLNESAEALLRECNNSIPKAPNGLFNLGNSDLQTDNTFLDEWWSLLWSLQTSVTLGSNPMGNQQRMLTPQQQMILQQRMFQQQQQQQHQLQQQRLQQQALIQQQQQQRIIASRQQQQQQQQQQAQTQQSPQGQQQQQPQTIPNKSPAVGLMGPPSGNLQSRASPSMDQLQSQARLQQLKLQFQQQQQMQQMQMQQQQQQQQQNQMGRSPAINTNGQPPHQSPQSVSQSQPTPGSKSVSPKLHRHSTDEYLMNLLQMENQSNLQRQRFMNSQAQQQQQQNEPSFPPKQGKPPTQQQLRRQLAQPQKQRPPIRQPQTAQSYSAPGDRKTSFEGVFPMQNQGMYPPGPPGPPQGAQGQTTIPHQPQPQPPQQQQQQSQPQPPPLPPQSAPPVPQQQQPPPPPRPQQQQQNVGNKQDSNVLLDDAFFLGNLLLDEFKEFTANNMDESQNNPQFNTPSERLGFGMTPNHQQPNMGPPQQQQQQQQQRMQMNAFDGLELSGTLGGTTGEDGNDDVGQTIATDWLSLMGSGPGYG
ncbi:Transcription activator MSS11 [Candida viswanathii]|uniref:Transcription activator MSS11 n=1 Tax=Candida viswanathii TaxID=5486 RepID=A0A367Y046_9ASCO|nr:Transcription activator MSS11 [Candida viswanathii]